jgi:macrolide transport system ATP-binding/permease protein
VSLITLSSISRVYGGNGNALHALDDINLTIERGEFVAIMGPSGSGKSTLLNILGCLDRPDAGHYHYDGAEVTNLSTSELATMRNRRIGFVFQNFNLLPRLSAVDNVALPLCYRHVRTASRQEAAGLILRAFGLASRSSHEPVRLSGGEQQRVAIARAVAGGSELILADEPTGALDSHSSDQVLEIISQLNAQGITIVMVTHDEDVARKAKRIVRLRDGRIVADAPTGVPSLPPTEPPRPKTTARAARKSHILTSLRLNFAIALASLHRHRLRSALTVLGIVIGIAAVITMVTLADGAEEQVSARIRSLGSNLLLVMPGTRNTQGVRGNAGSHMSLTVGDAHAIAADIPDVTVASPFLRGHTQIVAGNRNWSTTIAGVLPNYLTAREWLIGEGESIAGHHQQDAAKVVVIGRTVARELFDDASPIGQVVRIGRTPFTIIGVLHRKGQTATGTDQDDVLMMPLSTAQIRVAGRDKTGPDVVHAIVVKVFDELAMTDAASDIRRLLRQRHRLSSRVDDDFTIQNLAEISEVRRAASREFTVLVAMLASVSLVVGGIGIMNIMLVSVTERMRENGLRLAVGARPYDLASQYLVEAVALSLIGGLAGILAGVTVASAISHALDWPAMFRPGAAVVGVSFSAIVGLIFGLYPAFKAARINPIQALRTE